MHAGYKQLSSEPQTGLSCSLVTIGVIKVREMRAFSSRGMLGNNKESLVSREEEEEKENERCDRPIRDIPSGLSCRVT